MTDAKPFKFRYARELAGVFVLLALVGLVAATVVAGRIQGWFEPTLIVKVRFGEEGALGLQPGAEVWILDTAVGYVREIRPDELGRMTATLGVRGAFAQFVRRDSVAVIKRKFQVAGDTYVDITRGLGAELTDEDPYIPMRQDTQLLDLARETLDVLSASAQVVLEELMRTIQQANQIAEGINNPEGSVQKSLAHLETIMAGLATGEGTAGQVLRDPALADGVKANLTQVEALLGEVRGQIVQVEAILADVKEVTGQMPGLVRNLEGKVDQVPALLDQAHATLRDSELLIEGVQRHWLIRRYIPEPASARPLRPAEVALPPPGVGP